MAWEIKYSDTALKELKKLDKGVAKEVLDYMDEKIAVLEDPTTAGKGLTGTLATFWRYRVRDMRVICSVDKSEVTVLVLRVGHRKEVYGEEKKIAAKAAGDVEVFQKERKEEKEKAQQAAQEKTNQID
ncbi:MAG: type II toxin-antitoxin system RelE/ParE family toxin [Cyanobacteria bacterium REEB67]|nr:type II toxin-antitoxin system RelE/ParE family toxin [Cyanobacteria bacterium REEB67]